MSKLKIKSTFLYTKLSLLKFNIQALLFKDNHRICLQLKMLVVFGSNERGRMRAGAKNSASDEHLQNCSSCFLILPATATQIPSVGHVSKIEM